MYNASNNYYRITGIGYDYRDVYIITTHYYHFMHIITGTPGASPYGGCYSDFNVVEANMKLRFGEMNSTTNFISSLFFSLLSSLSLSLLLSLLRREMLYEALKGTSVFPLALTAFPR